MPGNDAVKSTARVILKSCWPQLIAAAFLLLCGAFIGIYIENLILLVFGRIAGTVSVPFIIGYWLCCFSPLTLGVLRYVWRRSGGAEPEIDSVFYYFSSSAAYFKSVYFSLCFTARMVISAAVAFLPYLALIFSNRVAHELVSEQTRMHVMLLSILFAVVGVILFIVLSVRYYIAPLLFVGSEQLEVAETFYLSKLISRETAGAYIVLLIGMCGWLLLSLFGVTLVFTLPYMLVAYAVHCRYAVYFHNHRARMLEETDFPEYRSSF